MEMEQWDKAYIDLVVPGYIAFREDHLGEFQFGTVHGNLDYRLEPYQDTERLEFSWEGEDEMDLVRGEYRKYKATFHASPPSGASQHSASDHPAPLGTTPSRARASAGQPCRQPAGRSEQVAVSADPIPQMSQCCAPPVPTEPPLQPKVQDAMEGDMGK